MEAVAVRRSERARKPVNYVIDGDENGRSRQRRECKLGQDKQPRHQMRNSALQS